MINHTTRICVFVINPNRKIQNKIPYRPNTKKRLTFRRNWDAILDIARTLCKCFYIKNITYLRFHYSKRNANCNALAKIKTTNLFSQYLNSYKLLLLKVRNLKASQTTTKPTFTNILLNFSLTFAGLFPCSEKLTTLTLISSLSSISFFDLPIS